MKKILFLSSILLISLTSIKAQKAVTLAEDSVKFGSRYFPGFWVTIPETKPADVKTNWIKTIEKGTRSKVTIELNEMTLFGAILPEVYKGSVNVISKTVDQDSVVQLFVCIETTRDNFITSGSGEYDNLKAYFLKFAKNQYIDVVRKQLSAEEDILRKFNKELKSFRSSNNRFEKGIQSAKVTINQQNDKIDGIKKEIDILDIRIGNSSTAVSVLEEGDDKNVKQSELKTYQKKKKSLLNSINSTENRISKANTTIQDNQRDIELNADIQNDLTEKINQQKLVIASFQQKLKNVQAY